MNQWIRPTIVLVCAMLPGIPNLADSAEGVKGRLRLTGSSTMLA